jgi:hypothetical protein
MEAPQSSWKRSITIPCTIQQGSIKGGLKALVDTGATGIGYIHRDLAREMKLIQDPLPYVIYPTGFTGTVLDGGEVSHTVKLTLRHDNHTEHIRLYVTNTGRHELILGQPWMYKHRVTPNYDTEKLEFLAHRCVERCFRRRSISTPDLQWPSTTSPRKKRPPTPVPTIHHRHHHGVQKMRRALSRSDSSSDSDDESKNDPEESPEQFQTLPELDIYAIGAAPFMKLAQKRGYEICAITIADIDKALAEKTHTDPATKVPPEYHDLLDVFSRKDSDKLPPRRSYDHKIKLEEGKQPTFGPLYGMSLGELKVLRKYLQDNLSKGFIRASSSPAASPVIFVKKPGGGLRFCVDYRALNAISVKNRYPIPLIQETLNRLSKAKFYTKFDIIAAFNRLRVAEGDEWKTAFRTRYGLFEYLVMPFGLANAPSTFQHFVNDVLRPFLDVFCTAYIDDILIYSNSLREHKKHVRLVLEALKEAGLQLDIDKSEFHKTEVTYLGYVISTEGVKMDPKKVQAIIDWEAPKNVKDVRAFLGFANFYRRFIANFSATVAPLVGLTKKDTAFKFTDDCQRAFDHLKRAFTSAPILRHFDPDLPIIVEADASDYVTAGVLSQTDAEGVVHPIAYFSKRMNPAEGNYEIYDKELLAIIRCFEQWRPELEGARFPIDVLSDHKNLQYFTTTKQLSHRQARWSEYLSRFNFTITYRPGKQGEKPDALTRRSQDQPAQDEARAARQQTLLRPELFKNAESVNSDHSIRLTETDRTIPEIIEAEYHSDEFISEILELLRNGTRRSKKISLSECEERDGRLFFRDRLVIPKHDELIIKILRVAHDSPAGGHPGRGKTLDIIQREYYWPGMFDSIRRYVNCCHTCHRSKASREKYHGLLKSLPVPERRWQDISVDFVVDLPESEGYKNIMVVVDRLSKYRYLIPCKSMEAPEVARLFFRHVWVHHGLPTTIVSDRGRQFVSAFHDELCKQLMIKLLFSSAHHPETDGQTEIANAIMEQVLRAYTNYHQDDWVSWLPTAQFEANNTVSETTGVSPMMACYGQHPRMGFELPSDTRRPRHQALQAHEANTMVDKMRDITEFIREEMIWAQALQQEYANRKRSPAPAYQIGDKVWLNARNIRTERASKKLDWKNVGPYKVIAKVSSHAYKLELPDSMKIHPVFHVSLLRPAAHESDYLPGQLEEPPEPVVVDGELEYFVESIEDMRFNRRSRKWEYLVKWTGYDELSWEPAQDMDALEAIDDFHRRNPDKEEPPEVRDTLAGARE